MGRRWGWIALGLVVILLAVAMIGACAPEQEGPEAAVDLATPTLAAEVSSPTATPSATPTETATSTPTCAPTSTPSLTSTPVPSTTPSATPTPTPTPQTLRVMVPSALLERTAHLPEFMEHHPGYRFLVTAWEGGSDVAQACRAGKGEICLHQGPLPDDMHAFTYAGHPVAAVVSFYKPLEKLALDDLQRILSGDQATLAQYGIAQIGAWKGPAVELAGVPFGEGIATGAAPELVAATGLDPSALALVPYGAVEPRVRALWLDGLHPTDPDYPLIWPEAVLVADPGLAPLAEDMAAVLGQSAPQEPETISLAVVGDMMLARDMGEALLEFGPDYAFGAVQHLLASADLAIGNLECAISDLGEPEPKAYVFRAPLVAAESLRDAGFDLVSLANNHILDFGVEAMEQTFDLLEQAGIAWVGAGMDESAAHAPAYLEVKGLRIAFLGYARYLTETSTGYPAEAFVAVGDRPGIAWAEVDRIRAEVAAAKENADMVIVAMHGGREYWQRPTTFQQEAAKAAIDAGASMVWGHHPHSWQGIEFYGDGVIFYSLGDFVFDQMTTNDTAVARCLIVDGKVQQVLLDPVTIVENGRPIPAPPAKGRAILDWLYGLSAEFAGLD